MGIRREREHIFSKKRPKILILPQGLGCVGCRQSAREARRRRKTGEMLRVEFTIKLTSVDFQLLIINFKLTSVDFKQMNVIGSYGGGWTGKRMKL